MSKKNFLTNMDHLFEGLGSGTLSESRVPEVRVRDKGSSKTDSGRKLSGLDALFQSAFEDGMNRPRGTRKPLPKSGLDSLIRQTVESSKVSVDYGARKRVTFLFEEDKLDQLKQVAREENKYLKDIISQIVSEYLDRHKNDE
ncbi:MAG: hypothetical protein KDC34_00685 [Saprospiraceae bacterium]|nr:hypothetical protein [Saprospiraceae bacterium]